MTPSSPSKPNRFNPILVFVVLIMTSIPTVLAWIFFFGRIYGAIALGVFLLLVVILKKLLKRRGLSEAEIMRRADKAGKDPREMANWVP